MPPATTPFQRHKQLYIDEEEKLSEIVSDDSFARVFQSWLDTMISQLDYQYENCERHLSELQQSVSVPMGSFWCSKTIMQHCNLILSEKRLINKKSKDAASPALEEAENGDKKDYDKANGEGEEDQATLPDLVRLASCLQQIKSSHFVTPKQKLFLEQFEARLKTVQLEPRDLIFILNALEAKLKDEGNARGIFEDLTALQNSIEDLLPSAERCEQLLEASIVNGEMALAEDISKRQIDTYEHILRLTTDQYPIISKHHLDSCEANRKRRWAIFRMADRDITTVIENKCRAIETCEDDFAKVKEQVSNYSNDDAQQRKRYELDRSESDLFLQQNKEKQQGVWNRIFGLFEELKTCQGELVTLAQQRKKEVQRRLEVEEREAGRRSGHESFLQAAEVHLGRLQDTLDNAAAARDLVEALNRFVLDGCATLTARYDQQQRVLGDLLQGAHRDHVRRFTDYAIVAHRFFYRRERRLRELRAGLAHNELHRQLRVDALDPAAKGFAEAKVPLEAAAAAIGAELHAMRGRFEAAATAVGPARAALTAAGEWAPPPEALVREMNLSRWEKLTTYRACLLAEQTAAGDGGGAAASTQAEGRRALLTAMAGAGALASAEQASPETPATRGGPGGKRGGRSTTRQRGHALDGGVTAAEGTIGLGKEEEKKEAANNGGGRLPTLGGGGGERQPAAACPPYPHAATTMEPRSLEVLSLPQLPRPSSASGSLDWASSDRVSKKGLPSVRGGLSGGAGRRVEGSVFKALHSYRSRAPDELNFEEGDSIVCIGQTPEEGWYRGICNQRTGIFPINYVELNMSQ